MSHSTEFCIMYMERCCAELFEAGVCLSYCMSRIVPGTWLGSLSYKGLMSENLEFIFISSGAMEILPSHF